MNSQNLSSDRRVPCATHGHEKPEASAEVTLKSDRIQVERKTFQFTLKENPRGRFLRITEDVGGRRDTIIVPTSGLKDFGRVLEEMSRLSEADPTAQP